MFKFYPIPYTKSTNQLHYITSIPWKRKLCTTGLDSLRYKKTPSCNNRKVISCGMISEAPHPLLQWKCRVANIVPSWSNEKFLSDHRSDDYHDPDHGKGKRSFVLFQSIGSSQPQLDTKQWTISGISDRLGKQSRSANNCILENSHLDPKKTRESPWRLDSHVSCFPNSNSFL